MTVIKPKNTNFLFTPFQRSIIRENRPFKVIYLPRWMHDATAVEFMGCFYFICMKSNQVHCFNPKKSAWEKIKSMHLARKEPRAAVHNGFLYVSSGDDLFNRTTAEKYDPNTKTWTMVTINNLKKLLLFVLFKFSYYFRFSRYRINWTVCRLVWLLLMMD